MNRRRLFRFSLRTILVIVLVLSVWLGWQANRAARQRRAVEALRAAGAQVFYDYDYPNGDFLNFHDEVEPPSWAWLRALVGVDFFANVHTVDIDKDVDAAAALNVLDELQTLRGLGITQKRIDTTTVAKILELHELEMLALEFSAFDDDVTFEALAELKRLRALSITYDNWSVLRPMPGRVEWVGELRHLEWLGLWGLEIHDEDLTQSRHLRRLKAVNLASEISDEGLAHLSELPALEELSLFAPDVSDRSVEHLSKLQSLKTLDLIATRITSEGIGELRIALPKTTITK